MSASTAIGMVSASLRTLLIEEMALNLTVDVTVLAPDERAGDRRVNLFLYRVEENPYLRQQEPTIDPADHTRLLPPPLSLTLYYLLTCYAPNDALTGNATAHQILGEAMRVFYENQVVPRRHLDAGLLDAREDLQVVSKSLDPEELSRIWSTFSQPFRLSVLYQVSTVQLDVAPAVRELSPKRVRSIGVPAVTQPPGRPVVADMTPSSGPVRTAVGFTGAHLDGWWASVTFGGREVLARVRITGDSVGVVVPADFVPGFYDVRIDVGRVFRRTFLFEITP